jgi:ABC-type oligopeptide transport system substrate-binding subunit
MDSKSRFVSSLLLAAALTSSVLSMACAEHHSYRVYDPYYSDYHVWNGSETVYYQQWSRENHRDSSRDFRKLPPEEQKEYFTWRHSHGDNDHH